jgi:hypothetical protein
VRTRTLLVAAVVVLGLAVPTAAVTVADSTDPIDEEGTVTLAPHEGPNGEYARINGDDEIELQFDELNDDARTTAHNVFTVNNDREEAVTVWVTTDVDDGVTIYEGEDTSATIQGEDQAVTLQPGESLAVGFVVNTMTATPSSGTVTIHARTDEEAGDDGGDGGDTSDDGGSEEGDGGDGDGQPEIVLTDFTAPDEVMVNEPARLTATVENRGNATGEATLELRVDGTVVAQRTVSVAAGERRTVTFTRTFQQPGEYELSVGGTVQTVTPVATVVSVMAADDEGSAAFEVTDARVEGSDLAPGETATVLATVENTGDAAGTFTAELTVAGVVVDTRAVEVPAGERRTVQFEWTFEESGIYPVGVSGTAAGEVEVSESDGDVSERSLPSSLGALSAGVGAVWLLLLLGLGKRRRDVLGFLRSRV